MTTDEDPVERLLQCLASRRDMNLKTSNIHPDHTVRHEAKIRVTVYQVAIEDVRWFFERETND